MPLGRLGRRIRAATAWVLFLPLAFLLGVAFALVAIRNSSCGVCHNPRLRSWASEFLRCWIVAWNFARDASIQGQSRLPKYCSVDVPWTYTYSGIGPSHPYG